MNSSTDRIERKIQLQAPRSKVWRALTDPTQFGQWFGVKIHGTAFTPGQIARGRITYPGYEHLTMEIEIGRVEPEKLFSWRWHPAAIDPAVDYSKEPTTTVVFELEDVDGGTLLTLVESGIDAIPVARRLDVFRMNSQGWDEQMTNIEKHVAAT
jgi:uncharacterized protein YndB with AHSA1/START domain